MTASTVLKAAWALGLSAHTNHKDVLFAEITFGRSTVPPGVTNAPGCCIAAVPVRVALDHSTIGDLLYSVRHQQLSGARYDSVGLETIMKECTGWRSQNLHFSSVLNHQGGDRPAAMSGMTLGCTPYSLSVLHVGEVHSFVDVYITSVQQWDRVDVTLAYAADSVTEAIAQRLLSNLLATIEAILQVPLGTSLGILLK